MKKELRAKKQKVFDYINMMLGGGMVDVELDPEHYETALQKSLSIFRQRSDNAVEESYFFMETLPEVNTYTLPKEIIEVERIHRSGPASKSGATQGGFEPFQLAQTNTYLLSASNNLGGMATFDFYSQYQELVGRMFGSFIEFTWGRTTKKLTILQKTNAQEKLLLKCYNYRPDWDILDDYMAAPWINDYALAVAKFMIGEARSKFSSIAGPQGGGTLNGDALKAEAQQEMEKLIQEVGLSVPGGTGYGFVIG